ncbi:MAG: GAF domain-containing protein [Myxococcota bacterium]
MNDPELMRETLFELAKARDREREMRQESQALLEGLRILTLSQQPQSLFLELLEVLRGALEFESAVVLREGEDHQLHPEAFTDPAHAGRVIPRHALFERVLQGAPTALVDVSRIPDWPFTQAEVCGGSALLAPLRGGQTTSLLICLHQQRAFFTQRHVSVVRKLAPLAAQALIHRELKNTLEERDRFFYPQPGDDGHCGSGWAL